jgi:hypothetical protein
MKRQSTGYGWIKRRPSSAQSAQTSSSKRRWKWPSTQAITNIVGVLTVAAAVGQIWVMQSQLKQMREDKRPWIAIDDLDVTEPLAFHESMGALIYPTLRLTASGGEPAYFVRPVVFLLPAGSSDGAGKCESLRKLKLGEGESYLERTFFPSRTYDHVSFGQLKREELIAARNAMGQRLLLHAYVCVTYHDRHGAVHQTTRMFRITGRDPSTGKASSIDSLQPSVLPAQLIVHKTDFAEAGRAD